MTREEFQVYQLECGLLEKQLAQIEKHAREILTELGCVNTTPEAIYAILNGEAPAPWSKKKKSKRKIDKERARHAMFTLIHVRQTRQCLGPAKQNAPRAALEAMMAGAFGGDTLILAKLGAAFRPGQKKGGDNRGKQITAESAKVTGVVKPQIKKHFDRWCISDELQDRYPSEVTFIHEKTGIGRKTVERAVKLLKEKGTASTTRIGRVYRVKRPSGATRS